MIHLGLDFGTSGARACALAEDGRLVWQHQRTFPDPDAQTPAHWLDALHGLLTALPAALAGRLGTVTINGTSATVLLCDAALQPVSPVLRYDDGRARAQTQQLRHLAPPNQPHCDANAGLAKFLWLTQPPEPVRNAAHFMHQADWLAAQLRGGSNISDYHNALKTGYDVENLRWPDWVRALPHAALLPEVVAPGSDTGTIAPAVAKRFGLPPDCRMRAGTTDSGAAFIASGITEPGTGLTSLGSTLVLKQLSRTRIEAPAYGIYSHRFGRHWLVGGASNAGAAVLRQHFDAAALARLSAQIDPETDSPLDYYPLPRTGERFPHNDPELSPRLTPRPVDDAAFLHGLLQGLARIEQAGYACLHSLGAPALLEVRDCGGGATNATWRRLRQRLLGVPIAASEHSEAAYGAALLGLRGRCD